jgi:hypothetical protein
MARRQLTGKFFMKVCFLLVLALPALGSSASAQFNDTWIQFVRDDAMISSASPISNVENETDLAWGDLDKNGMVDLVVVRTRPFIAAGKRTNVLLMNENGVLVDRTADFAAQSDVPGDMGFLTPTQDRDVVLADVDGDTWLDVITATDQPAPGDSKSIAHPRIYINLGNDTDGGWLGLRHEDARIPQLLTFGGGTPVNPRFFSVSAGDVDDDGFIDLYFGDQDYVGIFVGEPGAEDTEDRLLINDGSGFFTDQTLSHLTLGMATSDICNNTVLADFNVDGQLDLLKQNGHGNSTDVIYNDPITPGSFTSWDENVYSGSPYFANSGDLNGDGRPDLVISDNGTDKFLINTGTDVNDKATWGPPSTYEFLAGSDDGFGANSLVADLDLDGWDDVLIADVDPEIPGYTRRLHIYHNRGGTVGGTDIVLREERQSTSNTDWIGVVGMETADLKGTHDVAVFDVDNDGLQDIIVSQLEGTFVWRQITAWADLGNALSGTHGAPVNTPEGTLVGGWPVSITLSNALENTTAFFVIGAFNLSAPFKGGVLVPNPTPPGLFVPIGTGPGGTISLVDTWPMGLPPGLDIFVQWWIIDGTGLVGFAASNAVQGTTP